VSQLQIYSASFSWGDSQRLGWSSGNSFLFTFSPLVQAVGMELFSFRDYSGTSNVDVYGPNNDLIGTITIAGVNSATIPRFLGFESEAGISQILVSTFTGGPNFDNVTFGNFVPEPGSSCLVFVAFLTATLCRRMAFSQTSAGYGSRRR
jgi:hypothetical protein